MRGNSFTGGLAALAFVLTAAAGAPAGAQAPGGAYPQAHVDLGDQVVGLPDVVYAAPMGFRPLKLDIYAPKATGRPLPLVVWVHGGGWMLGNPRLGADGKILGAWPQVLTRLAARGYIVASVSYRLSGEARFPAAAQDVKTAIRWLRTNAATYNIDPARVAIWGASAGGHLAALTGTSCGVGALEPAPAPARPGAAPPPPLASDCVQAVVDWYGPTDLARMDAQALPGATIKHNGADGAEFRFMGCLLPQCPADLLNLANPITHIDASDPPFLIMHGDDDTTVAPGQSQELYDALRAKGVSAQLIMVPGVAHSFAGIADADAEKVLQTVFAFLDRTVGKP